jgi:hypothetical protein
LIIGVIGTILLAIGLVLSTLGFNAGINITIFGLATIIVILIFYVVATAGIDTYPPGDILSGR